jgi:MYXO-CTERM domain-containing protein
MELEFGEKIGQMQATVFQAAAWPLSLVAVVALTFWIRRRGQKSKSS